MIRQYAVSRRMNMRAKTKSQQAAEKRRREAFVT
jgi:hypothetical protein